MSAVSTEVMRWVAKFAEDITGDGTVHRFELWHSLEEGGSRLQVWVLGALEDAEPADVAQEIWDVAEADAATRGVGMVQRYVMLVFRNEEDRDCEAQHAFNLQGRSVAGNVLGGDTDRANDKGFQAQQMRHNEHLHTLLIQQTTAVSSKLVQELTSERSRREHLENKLSEMFEIRESLLDRKHERELEAAQELAKAQRHEQIMAMLLTMGQLVGAKLLGGAGSMIAGNMPAQAARDGAIGNLLGNLSQDEMMKVLSALSPENQNSLMQLYSSYREDFEKAEQAKPEPLRSANGAGAGN